MSVAFGPTRSTTINGSFCAWYGADQLVWRATYNGSSGNIECDLCSSQGYVKDSTVTVDNTTTGRNDVMLNEAMILDAVTGRLHLLYAANVNDASNPPRLYHKSSTNNGSTWSSAHQLDDGTGHGGGTPNNRFYRVGIAAYNDYVTVCYSSTSRSTFIGDGLYEVHSADGGATWSAPAKLYTSPVMPGEPNVAIGPDGAVHVSWYDPGVLANQGGDVYYVRGDFNGSGWTWPGSVTRLTTGEVWGRTRVFTSNGVVMIVGNTNWGGNSADVGLLRSTDNGASWGTTVTLATHTGVIPLDHPWGAVDSNNAAVVWVTGSSPITYSVILSTDAGASWGSPITPMTTTSNSDAPRMVLTKDLLIVAGVDGSNNCQWAAYPLFAPDPAVSSVIDAFNRANENPLSDSGKWTQNSGTGNNCKLVSNQCTRQLGAGSFDRSGNYRNDISFSGSYEVYCDIVTAGGEVDLFLWNPSTQNGYLMRGSNSDFGNTIDISKMVGGAETVLFTYSAGVLSAGDTLLLREDANCIVGMKLTSGVWTEVARGKDTTYRNNTQRPGLDIAGQAGVPVVDNFSGGVLNVPSNTIAPVVSGVVNAGSTLSTTDGTWATAQGAKPTRYTYQWQQSTDGGNTWTNITRATLRLYKITTPVGQYRVQVTGYNSMGSATVNSNAIGFVQVQRNIEINQAVNRSSVW